MARTTRIQTATEFEATRNFMAARRAQRNAQDAIALAEAIAEFNEWDAVRTPGTLLKIWSESTKLQDVS